MFLYHTTFFNLFCIYIFMNFMNITILLSVVWFVYSINTFLPSIMYMPLVGASTFLPVRS